MKIDKKKNNELANKLKAIAHPDRLCIVRGLIEQPSNVSNIQTCNFPIEIVHCSGLYDYNRYMTCTVCNLYCCYSAI